MLRYFSSLIPIPNNNCICPLHEQSLSEHDHLHANINENLVHLYFAISNSFQRPIQHCGVCVHGGGDKSSMI